MLFFWTVYSSKNPEKNYYGLESTNNFNIDNKYFLSTKSAY